MYDGNFLKVSELKLRYSELRLYQLILITYVVTLVGVQ